MGKPHIPLNSAEYGGLWTQYMNDSLAAAVFKFLLKTVEDVEIQRVLQFTSEASANNLKAIGEIFAEEKLPIPIGFTDEDVNLDAPRLFPDVLYLYFVKQLGKVTMPAQSLTMGTSTRADVRELFWKVIDEAHNVNNMVTDLLLSKGLYIKPPYLPYPQKAEFVTEQKFLGSMLGEKRVLTALEAANLHGNIQHNTIGQMIIMGFAQVAQSTEIRDYFLRGKEIAKKSIEVFSTLLKDDDLPVSMPWDLSVTTSQVAPFSEKLMMSLVSALSSFSLTSYGLALSASLRSDVSSAITRQMAEVMAYAEDGANILIKNGWMEQPPTAANRRELAMTK